MFDNDCIKIFITKSHFDFQYISELALMDVALTKYPPSVIACSAVAIVRSDVVNNAWDANLERITGYSLRQLEWPIRELFAHYQQRENSPLQAINNKYNKEYFYSIAYSLGPRTLRINF